MMTLQITMIVWASVTLMGYTADQNNCRTVQSIRDRILRGHVTKITTGKSFERCTIDCEKQSDCFSINYVTSSATCQMNNTTAQWYPKDFVPWSGALYMDSLVRQYETNTCKDQIPPCDGLCVAVPEERRSICVCRVSNCQPDVSSHVSFSCESPSITLKAASQALPSNKDIILNGVTRDLKSEKTPKVKGSIRFISDCKAAALGMENGEVKDAQIMSSSTHATRRNDMGRLNFDRGSWTPSTDDEHQWYQVTFAPHTKVFTQIATQGDGVNWWWVTKYYIDFKKGTSQWLRYSEDGNTPMMFKGNTDSTNIVKNTFTKPFIADTIKIKPVSFTGRIALRIELYGCDV